MPYAGPDPFLRVYRPPRVPMWLFGGVPIWGSPRPAGHAAEERVILFFSLRGYYSACLSWGAQSSIKTPLSWRLPILYSISHRPQLRRSLYRVKVFSSPFFSYSLACAGFSCVLFPVVPRRLYPHPPRPHHCATPFFPLPSGFLVQGKCSFFPLHFPTPLRADRTIQTVFFPETSTVESHIDSSFFV